MPIQIEKKKEESFFSKPKKKKIYTIVGVTVLLLLAVSGLLYGGISLFHELQQSVEKEDFSQKINSLDNSLSSNMDGTVEKIKINEEYLILVGKVLTTAYQSYVVIGGKEYTPDNDRELYDIGVGDKVMFRGSVDDNGEYHAYYFRVEKREVKPIEDAKRQEEIKNLPKGYTAHEGTIQEVAVNEPYTFNKTVKNIALRNDGERVSYINIDGFEYETSTEAFLYNYHKGDHILFYLDNNGKLAGIHLLK